MRLSESLAEDPKKSEMEMFKAILDRTMAIQQQLHSSYHGDRQLRDRLMNGVNLPSIQDALTDRQPRTAHQINKLLANKLSHKKGTESTSVALLTSNETPNNGDAKGDQAFYRLGQRYGGEAKSRMTHYGPKAKFVGKRHETYPSNNYRQQQRQRRPIPWWMRGVKGCFVCRKPDHNANERHSRDEVSTVIKNLKMKHPTALLTEEDKEYITDLFADNESYEDQSTEEEVDLVNWAEQTEYESQHED